MVLFMTTLNLTMYYAAAEQISTTNKIIAVLRALRANFSHLGYDRCVELVAEQQNVDKGFVRMVWSSVNDGNDGF